jgi:HSP20 family molecular chaperone IbpA
MSETMVKNNAVTERNETVRPTARRPVFTPHVDILERADELVLVLDVPGVKAEDVEVHFERGELIVKGRRTADFAGKGRSLVEELVVGDYYRAFLISQDVAADKITADLKHGVLTVHLPKSAAAQPRRIDVKVG